MNLESVSIIFPIYNLQDERLRNFTFNLERSKDVSAQIIVVEQIPTGTISKLVLPSNVLHIKVESRVSYIEKSRLVNIGAQQSTGSFLWVNDADLYVPFQKVIEAIKPYFIVVKPFKYFVKLTEPETQTFLYDRKVVTQSPFMDGLCAGSFIVRKAEYIKIRGMDERYRGWGYEDMELALRLQALYPVEILSHLRGVHLYHPKEFGTGSQIMTTNNLDHFTEAKKIIGEDVFEQINKVVSPFDKAIGTEGKNTKVIHVTCPALMTTDPRFMHRQLLALNTINKADDRNVIKIAALAKDEFEARKDNLLLADWKKESLLRDAKDIGHSKALPYLKDLLDLGRLSASPDDFILISNSDCGCTNSFYKRLLNADTDYVEYFRVNVFNATSVEDLLINEPGRIREEKDGIDAFAIKASVYDEVKDQIPDLLLGEPYWDPVISGIMKKRSRITQNTTDLRHPEHNPQWDLSKLSKAGSYNKKLWQEAFDKKLLNIRKCELLSDTIIIRVHGAGTDYKKASNAFKELKKQDLYANYVFVDVVDKVKDSLLRDDELGTTGGHRVIIEKQQDLEETYKRIIDSCPNARFIIFLNEYAYSDDLSLLKKTVKNLSDNPDTVIETSDGLKSTSKIENGFWLKAMTRMTYKCMMNGKESIIDTAVIIATFGEDKMRSYANSYAFRQLQRQSLKVHYVWVEMLEDGQVSQLRPDMLSNPRLKHIVVRSKPQNKRIFQKESLWNLAVKTLPPEIRFLYFMDSDIYCDKKNWFAKIRETLDFDQNSIVQPGTEVITLKTGDMPEITRTQLTFVGHEDIHPTKQPYNFNPGLAVCMNRSKYDEIGGFNPYGVMYGGDTLFLIETCRQSHIYYKHLMSQSSMRNSLRRELMNRRNLKINWRSIDNYITHVWHGEESNRTYWAWEHFLTTIDFNSKDRLYTDDQGLLAWHVDYPLFNYVYDRRMMLKDKHACRKLIREFYDFHVSNETSKIIFSRENFAVDIWTLNVRRGEHEIFCAAEGEGYLHLEADIRNKASNGMIAVISLAPHFTSINISEMKNPHVIVELRAKKQSSQEVYIAMQTKPDSEEKAKESKRLSFSSYGSLTNDWSSFSFPISDFGDIDLKSLYAVVLKGDGEMTLDVRSIKIES